ncbi:hypothetical protein M431DRAFT_510914 [Trichoderma harzianum CBS 226.95]|uniref:Uncharacterized protein n=1 Tax=Trichoderma harzianum CBS 226.95 TaxID=983964 RepID=A0A2T4A3Z1_TRIHA|nr:hypothetical protein M431DRAFT_510914 [Trichoderma harzianum CBS 226.95]PTB51764.1 hypothetical protein M431DRAFT_510914 [Trichoderma harzianum CBS 226.95]
MSLMDSRQSPAAHFELFLSRPRPNPTPRRLRSRSLYKKRASAPWSAQLNGYRIFPTSLPATASTLTYSAIRIFPFLLTNTRVQHLEDKSAAIFKTRQPY